MRLRSSTKVPGVSQQAKPGPVLKKPSISTLDKMPIVVLDSLIERLDAKSLIALKNSNKKLERAVRSNKLRMWKRFRSLNIEILRFGNEVKKLCTKLLTFAQSSLTEGQISESDIIEETSKKCLKSYKEVCEKLRSTRGIRLRNAWKKDTGKYSDVQKKLISGELMWVQHFKHDVIIKPERRPNGYPDKEKTSVQNFPGLYFSRPKTFRRS